MSTTPAAESKPPKRSTRKNGVPRVDEPLGATIPPQEASFASVVSQDWDRWCRQLRKRWSHVTYTRMLPGGAKKISPFAWFLPSSTDWEGTHRLLDALHQVARRKATPEARAALGEQLADWLASAPNRSSHALLVEALAWTAVSPQLTSVLPRHQWLELMEFSEGIAADSNRVAVTEEPVTANLVAELGWWLALLDPEFAKRRRLVAISRDVMSRSLCDLTDGEGLLAAQHWLFVRPLLACWTRSRLIADALDEKFVHNDANVQWKWFVRQALLLTRSDGSDVFGDNRSPWNRTPFRIALDLEPDRLNNAIAQQLLPEGKRLVRKLKAKPKKRLPKRPSNISEWAEGAILRSDWSAEGPLFCATFQDQRLTSELSIGDALLWSGPTQPTVTINKVPLDAGEIRVACLFHDKDVEYVELEIDYGQQWLLQRQMLLARNDQFLLFADALIGPATANIHYRLTLPLVPGAQFRAAPETREGEIVATNGKGATILPIALPEWRTESAAGDLAVHQDGLAYRATANARTLFNPLFIDLEPTRRSHPLTWRRLTVAENRQVQPSSVATGYRVQIGNKQWLIYRSLNGKASRTVLGQHLLHEFVVGRFQRNGALDTFIQIEPADD